MRLSGSGGAKPDEPDSGVITETEEKTVTRHCPRYKVFIHNDPITSMEFVVHVLTTIFTLGHKQAVKVMFEAHTNDIAFVGAYSLEQAEFRVEQAHSLARAAKYPLKFTYEPE